MEIKLTTEQLNAKKQYWDYNQGLVVLSNGHLGKWTAFTKPLTHVNSETLDSLALHSPGPETTQLKGEFTFAWIMPLLT